jgi:rhodanese-related sulfurtransferase
MKHFRSMIPVSLLVLVILAVCAGTGLAGSDVPMITVDELKARLDEPDLIILDVRQEQDWASSDFKIRYAIYADPKSYDEWGAAYPKDQPIVLYCA